MYPPRKPSMKQPLYTKLLRSLPGSAYMHSVVLHMRRLQRISRPLFPITIRLILVILTVTQFYINPFQFSSPNSAAAFTSFETSSKMSTIISGSADTGSSHNEKDSALSAPSSSSSSPSSSSTSDSSSQYYDPSKSTSSSSADLQLEIDSPHLSSYTSGSGYNTTLQDDEIDYQAGFLLVLSRLAMVSGILTCFLSVIFFDNRMFNLISVSSLFVHILTSTSCSCKTPLSYQWWIKCICNTCFMATPILFSMLVGRRRSISKPSALRTNKRTFIKSLPYTVRHVDLIDLAVRVQASLLLIDLTYYSSKIPFLISIPLALAFIAGYAIRRIGFLVTVLLIWSAFLVPSSPLLALPSSTTAATATASLLAVAVGPGHLTVDEWLASTYQLCY